MEWKVENALSRDVERQHLNKILKEIRTVLDAIETAAGGPTQNVAEQIGAMVENNTEVGLSVTYDPDNEVLNFVADNFVITLEGDVTGSAEVVGLNSVTIQTEIDPSARGIEEAPTDGIPYWRIDGEWEDVGDNLVAIRVLGGLGFPARAGIGDWNIRQFEADAGELVVANPDGVAGNVSYGLAEVVPGTGGVLTAIETDEFGRVVEQHPVVITGTAGEIEVVDGDGALGAPTISLAEVTNTGVGVSPIKIYTRDEFGRIEGDEDADTGDLPEGSNLYFTDERAQDAVGTILIDSADIDFTYDDTTPSITAALTTAVHDSLDLADSAVQSVVAGTNITVDNTDPQNPIVSASGGGSGTVTSVAVSGTDGIEVDSGSPITTSGTIQLGLSAAVLGQLADASTAVQPGDNVSVLTNDAGYVNDLGDLGITASAAELNVLDGITASTAELNFTDGVTSAIQTQLDGKEAAFSKGDLVQGSGVTLTGTLTGRLVGSGNVTIAASGGGSGTVTSVDIDDATGISFSGGPITGSGSFTPALSANLQAWHGLATSAKQDADADLTAIAGASPAANQGIYWTGAGAVSTYSLTAGGRALGGVAGTANTAPYFSAANTVSLQAVSASGRNLWNIGGTAGGVAYLSATNTWSLTMTSSYGLGLLNAASLLSVVGDAPVHYVLKGTGFGSDPAFGTLDTSDLTDVASGTYTPTITNVTNVAASTSNGAQYLRVGNTVTVSGSVDIDPTAAAATTIRISLPIASNFATNHDCAGTISSGNGEVGPVFANIANDNAQVQFTATNTANHTFYYHFTYSII